MDPDSQEVKGFAQKFDWTHFDEEQQHATNDN